MADVNGEVEVIDEETVATEEISAEKSKTAAESGEKLSSSARGGAADEEFYAVPIAVDEPTAEKEEEKTDDQVTEIEDEQNMGARTASLDEFRDIPIEADDAPASQADDSSVKEASVIEEVSVIESIEEEPKAAEPPTKEASIEKVPKESSPIARKKVTIEETPPPSSPKREEAVSPTRRDPSWWKKSKKPEEEEIVDVESVEELKSERSEKSERSVKSESRSAPVSSPKKERSIAESIPEPEPAPESVKEETPAVVVEEEVKDESIKEDSLKAAEESFVQVPIVVDEESKQEESKAEDEPIESKAVEEPSEVSIKEEKPSEPVKQLSPAKEPSPIRERVSRRDKAEAEERPSRATAVPAEAYATTPTPTPIVRTPTYVTYSSWAPASDYRTSYMPTYSTYVRPSPRYYKTDYTSSYHRPTSQFVRNFDNYVRTGAFGQSLYATERARSRTRSRERSGYSSTGYYTPPPLRTSRSDYSPVRFSSASSPSAAPSRSGSFVNFMDYIVTTDRHLRRSSSRGSVEDYAVSRSASRAILPTPADTINRWYDNQIWHVNKFVSRLNDVYDNNIHGYYSTYNTSRPYTGYVTSGLSSDYSTYSRSYRGYASDLERRLATHKTYLRAYDLTRMPKTPSGGAMTRSVFW